MLAIKLSYSQLAKVRTIFEFANLEEYGRQESKDYIQCRDVNHNDYVHRIQFDVLVELHDWIQIPH